MKKLFLVLSSLALITSCDIISKFNKSNESETENISKKERNEEREKAMRKERQVLEANESTARTKAINFVNKEGYSIQSIELVKSGVSSREYYMYHVTTGNTSSNGNLIYINITVIHENSNWTIDTFRAYIHGN